MLYKNSQKRIYEEDAIYFLTSKTKDNFPFFREELLCELWIEELKFCKKLKKFELFAFCLLPNHFHLLLRAKGKENISRVMHFLKRHFARNANFVLGYSQNINVGEVGQPRLGVEAMNKFVEKLKGKFIQKYRNRHHLPKFVWQKSFHHHIIDGESDYDYDNHFDYAYQNYLKHELGDSWKYTSLNYPSLIDVLGD